MCRPTAAGMCLAEEVIREYGYDHINPTFLNTASVTNGGLNYAQKQQLKTKRLLAAQGFYEASTLAFYSNAELDMHSKDRKSVV